MRKRNALLILSFLLISVEMLAPRLMNANAMFAGYLLTNASVEAVGPGSGQSYTNSTGQYSMTGDMPVGNYTMQARSNGFINEEINETVTNTSDIKMVNFFLRRSAIIKGQVLGNDSQPVIGADLSLYEKSGYFPVDYARTDSNGMYYFATNIDNGTYYVKVSFSFPFENEAFAVVYGGNYTGIHGNYQDIPYLDKGYMDGQSADIVAIAGEVSITPTIVLNGSGVITGTVKDSLNQPVPYAAVTARDMLTYSQKACLTDINGVYRFSYNIASQNYTIQPHAFGYAAPSIEVTAIEGSTVTHDFTLYKSATVRGYVLRSGDNRSVPDAFVIFIGDNPAYYFPTLSDSAGYYELVTGIGPGNYSVQVTINYFQAYAVNITLAEGQNLRLDFPINAYFISGTIYENQTSSGVTIPYAYVQLQLSSFPPPPGGFAQTDANGTYVMVLPIEEGTNGTEYSAYYMVQAYSYDNNVTIANVTVGVDLTNVDFALTKTPVTPPLSTTIVGTVWGAPGLDLPPSYQVWHVSSEGYNFTVAINTTSGFEEAFAFVLDGNLSVAVWGPEGTNGELTMWIPNDILYGSFTVSSTPGPDPTILSQTSNGTHTVITVSYGHSYRQITFYANYYIPEYSALQMLITALMAGTPIILLERRRKTFVH